MNGRVLLAVFKRNFVSYLTSPTGYVFICVFVLLSSVAAFLPDQFFSTNLANLAQLNRWFPFIMLVFIPAITMSIWADERRQGTDELLLTIPASDLDIVLAKYLAAVAIYTVSLVFSLVCNLWVLKTLGSPDMGLFLATYTGYWFVGLAMLAIGMVASFLTGNLTIAYLLGALFNGPLVVLIWGDSLIARHVGMVFKRWSIGEQFAEFGRGILSLSHVLYFVAIVAGMLYLSMVFIGARHWRSGKSSVLYYVLFAAQVVAVLVIGGNLCVLAGRTNHARWDATSEKLSSLSPTTRQLLDNLHADQAVQIEAFISPQVPELYVQTRLDILSMLRELKARGGKYVQLRINPTERHTENAARADQRYGITAHRVLDTRRGTFSEKYIYLGVAFTCGLEKVVLPFIDRGIPVEYELVRSISTVTQQKRKRIGVLRTDAQLYGQFNMMMGTSGRKWPIVDELEKQYEVVEVDPSSPITERYDALLAVQPSSLGPDEMKNFIEAVKHGQPTAIFEDPFPIYAANVPATSAPRRPAGGGNPMFGGGQPRPKGDVGALWHLLGVDFGGDQVIWQDHNPYPRFGDLPLEFVFVDEGQGGEQPFNEESPVSSEFQHMFFPFPGSIAALNASQLKFTPLIRTGEKTGTVAYREIMSPMAMFGMGGGLNPDRRHIPRGTSYVLAARIQGTLSQADPPAAEDSKDDDADKKAAAEAKKPAEVNVILVSDIDMLHEAFFEFRRHGNDPAAGVDLNFDNVPFVLNVLDTLAGDSRFIALRKRRVKHRTLTKVEEKTEKAQQDRNKTSDELREKLDKEIEKEQKRLDEEMDQLQEQLKKKQLSSIEILNRVGMAKGAAQKRLDAKKDQLEADLQRQLDQIETKLNLQKRRVQDTYKMYAVVLPPIPPLLIALIVFFTRRTREREGVARSRLRK